MIPRIMASQNYYQVFPYGISNEYDITSYSPLTEAYRYLI